MNLFIDLCIMFIPGILVWHIFLIFFESDGRYQKYRVRKSLDNIYDYQIDHKGTQTVPPEVYVTFKNRNFKVGVIKKDVNLQYSTYNIFINGEEAGIYHRLEHDILSSYYFETQNHRKKLEVIEIVNATAKRLSREMKKNSKAVSDTLTSCNNYSYFK